MRYAAKRFYNWSPSIAYSVGLMASDGCLSGDGRHLDLTSVDIDQLENFCRALGRPLPISEKHNQNLRTAYRVQFSDVEYYNFLLDVGLTPAKSLTLDKLNIPDIYYSHFLRGLFDGDGSTYGYFDPRWPKSFVFYTCFSSASLSFLYFISERNNRLISLKGSAIRTSVRVLTLGYAKADSYKLYDAMYENHNGLFLARKKVKLEGFMKQDKNATIQRLQARVL